MPAFTTSLSAQPYPRLKALHQGPKVIYLPEDQCWLVWGYAACQQVLKDYKTFSNHLYEVFMVNTMISLDPPLHGEARKPFNAFFSLSSVEAHRATYKPRVFSLNENLLASPFELYQDWALPMAIATTADFLGMIPDRTEDLINRCHDALGVEDLTLEVLKPYFTAGGMVDRTVLQNEALPEAVKIAHLNLFALAGIHTTAQGLANCAYLISQYPDAWQQVIDEPELLSGFIGECMRMEPAIGSVQRVAVSDCLLAGEKIKAGDRLIVAQFAANRDAEVFEEAFDFRLKRRNKKPLVYGSGLHKCLGLHLAQAIMHDVLKVWVDGHLRVESLGEQAARFDGSAFVRGVKEMQVRLVS